MTATIAGIIALSALLINVIDSAFGYVILDPKIRPSELAVDGVPLEEQDKQQLIAHLQRSFPAEHTISLIMNSGWLKGHDLIYWD